MAKKFLIKVRKVAKYEIVAVVKGVIEKDDTPQAEKQLWNREFNLTDISNPEILDVEEVELYDTKKMADTSRYLTPKELKHGFPNFQKAIEKQRRDIAWCDNCEIDERVDGEIWCQDCLDNYCWECGEEYEDCVCKSSCYDDDDEVVTPPLNAFSRARWLKYRGKPNGTIAVSVLWRRNGVV